MIVKPSHSFTGEYPLKWIAAQRNWHNPVCKTEVYSRVIGVVLPLFAALDASQHLLNGLYKLGYSIAGKVFTRLDKYTFSIAMDHFKQSLYFTVFAVVGSVATILYPELGIKRLRLEAIFSESDFNRVNFAMKEDKECLLNSVQKNPKLLFYIPDELKKDEDFLCEALSVSAQCFHFIPPELQKNKDFLLKKALLANPNCLHCIPYKMREDEDIQRKVLREWPQIGYYTEKFIIKEISADDSVYKKLSETHQMVKALASAFAHGHFAKHPEYFYRLPEELQQDKDFVTKLREEIPELDTYRNSMSSSSRETVVT